MEEKAIEVCGMGGWGENGRARFSSQKRKGKRALGEKDSGSVLLSHTDNRAVPSTLEGLTSEFEMGSGVAPPV